MEQTTIKIAPLDHIKVDVVDDIAIVTLNRPDKANAMDDRMLEDFVRVFSDLSYKGLRCAILMGDGDSGTFCAGYDLDEIDPDQPPELPLPDERFERAVHAIEMFGGPVVALLNGDAYGGGLDLALACDFRIAQPGIKVAMTSCRLGLVYSKSGVARFTAKLGAQTTRLLFLTAKRLSAVEALNKQVIDEIIEPAKIREHCLTLAKAIARNAPLAVQGTRRTIQLLETPLPCPELATIDLEEQREIAFRSRDLRTGLEAIKSKRMPTFSGK